MQLMLEARVSGVKYCVDCGAVIASVKSIVYVCHLLGSNSEHLHFSSEGCPENELPGTKFMKEMFDTADDGKVVVVFTFYADKTSLDAV